MDDHLFNDLIQSLDEALAYTQGDETKGRSQYISLSDAELEKRRLLWQKIDGLSDSRIKMVERYVDELLHA
ncbi:MAG: hypothetical protein FWE90_02050 [Defluviitaleaceae bacterium]|nr:hypothetical protein [Defluviitaleaceae bacterium]